MASHRIGLANLALALSLWFRAGNADVVVVVAANSTVVTLSKTQVLDIFLGKRTRFPDGSAALPIDQREGSVSRDEFYTQFAAMSPALVRAFWSKVLFTGRGQPPGTAGTTLELRRQLLANPNAIGYMDRAMLDRSLKVVLAP